MNYTRFVCVARLHMFSNSNHPVRYNTLFCVQPNILICFSPLGPEALHVHYRFQTQRRVGNMNVCSILLCTLK